MLLTRTRFATPETSVGTKHGEERWSSYLALDGSRCAKQRAANGRLCNRFEKLFGAIVQQRRRRRRTATTRKEFDARTKFNFQPTRSFPKHTPTTKYHRAGHVWQRKMSPSEDDSDGPEQVSLSTSRRQIIGRKKDVAKELAQAKSKQKEHNRERDRQLKEQSLKQRTELITDEEETSSGEEEEPEDPRLLPDHLFAAAFGQPSPAPAPSVLKDASLKTQQKKRKRADLTLKDRIIGQASPPPSMGTQLTLTHSSRAVRTLPNTSDRVAIRRALPSSSVAKFSSRALNAKGAVSRSRTRGWQRKAG
jgi:hypothetical protein